MLATPAELLDWLARQQFLRPAQADELRGAFPDVHALAKELLRRDWITPFQANQLLTGNEGQLVLGANRLLQRLGEGSMGQVFKAFNTRLQRVVAVKTIHKGLVDSPRALERFRREIEAAAQLRHPNIVLVRDADESDGRPYLVMEFIEGVNLSDRVKLNGPLPVHEAADYARQAALGLQHAHEHGMVHRDIKPANLMVSSVGRGPWAVAKDDAPSPSLPRATDHGQVKILDFGLARFDTEAGQAGVRLTQANRTLGTIDYISPEQAESAARADTRSDIYSLGCTLFYLLTGRPPFGGTTAEEKVGARLTGASPSARLWRDEVPEGLDAVLRRMMARHPAERYQSPAEVAAALQPYAVPLAAPVAAAVAEDPAAPPGFAFVDHGAESAPAEATEPEPTPVPHAPAPHATRGGGNLKVWLALLAGGGAVLVTALLVGLYLLTSLFQGAAPRKGYFDPGAALHITEALVSSDVLHAGDVKYVIVRIRRDEFDGPVDVQLEGLPAGVNAGSTTIGGGQSAGQVRIAVSYHTPPGETDVRVLARAENLSAEKAIKLRIMPDKR